MTDLDYARFALSSTSWLVDWVLRATTEAEAEQLVRQHFGLAWTGHVGRDGAYRADAKGCSFWMDGPWGNDCPPTRRMTHREIARALRSVAVQLPLGVLA